MPFLSANRRAALVIWLVSHIVAAAFLFLVLTLREAKAQLCAQLGGTNFSESFNTLAASGSVQLSNTFEFAFIEAGGDIAYTANNGSNSTGDTYSFGANGSSDRALGEITSPTVHTTIGACFTNNSNHAITSFLISYTGEQWRSGSAGGAFDRLDFGFSTDAIAIGSGTYITVNELDFTTPNNGAAVGQLDGNAAANRTVFAPTAITPAAPIQPEATFYIRWSPVEISGGNDGLAIDDFTMGAAFAPGLAGDYNANGTVDAADYVVWRNNLNQAVTIPNDITPGTVVAQDFIEWQNRFGFPFGPFGASTAVPEPATVLLALAACACVSGAVARRA
jgi:hypothetical protein